jgi:hypothetical protein
MTATAPRRRPFRLRAPLLLGGAVLLLGAHVGWTATRTVEDRLARDVARAVYNDNSALLEQVKAEAGAQVETLRAQVAAHPAPQDTAAVLVVSIHEKRLWYRRGDSVLFAAPIAVGSGKHFVVRGGSRVLHFDTPRGHFTVQRLDSAPLWIPPDWHYEEQARKRALGLVQLVRGRPLPLRDGSVITVEGNEVVRRRADGSVRSLTASDGREIVADGRIVIPPFGTTQRKYPDVLGPFRLYLGDGYGIHGTNNPASIGQAVSHGCIRLRNEDVTQLYHMVTVGTPVFIY